MFQFQSFHMYGIIMVAIGTGWLEPDYKKKKITDIKGTPIEIPTKKWAHIVTDWWVNFRTGLGTGRFLSGTDIYITQSWLLECSYCVFGALMDLFIWSLKDKLPH
jgi:hypothetical protein